MRNTLTAALLALLSACAPMEQIFSQSEIRPQMKEGFLLAGDRKKLPIKEWMPQTPKHQLASLDASPEAYRPRTSKPEAIIIALHGFNDYSNAFANAGEYFSVRNIGLLAFDQRGFGRTEQHGIWAGQPNLIQDTLYMVEATAEKYPDTPIYLLGESMGGAVVIATLAQHKLPQVKGAILSAPAIWGDETMNRAYRTSLWLVAHTMPYKKLTGSGLKILASDNIPMLIGLGKDPLVIKKTRVDAIYGIVHLMDTAYQSLDKVKHPLLLLYGAHDQVIPKEPLHRATHKLASTHQTRAFYPDGYHMLLRDLKADIVLNDMVSWVKNRNRPLPSGYTRNWELEFGKKELAHKATLPSDKKD